MTLDVAPVTVDARVDFVVFLSGIASGGSGLGLNDGWGASPTGFFLSWDIKLGVLF